MKNLFKKTKNDGFVEIIILIIIALLIMNYLGITISGVFNWIVSLFRGVFR